MQDSHKSWSNVLNEILKILENKKAVDVKVLPVNKKAVIADYFVIAGGTSFTHINAIAEELDYEFKKIDIFPKIEKNGTSNSWILLDFGNIIVHIFTKEAREFYNLENLWENDKFAAPILEL
jgi:ribosome-associated protein